MDELKTPDSKTIDFLYNGVINFYPDIAKEIFGLRGALGFRDTWGGFERMDFTEFVFNLTDTVTIEDAAKLIKSWKENPTVSGTIPRNIDELVLSLQKQQEENASLLEKKTAAKNALLESQKKAEEKERKYSQKQRTISPDKKIYYSPPDKIETPPFDTEAEKNLKKMLEAAKSNPAAFTQNLSQTIEEELKKNGYSEAPPELIKANAQIVAADVTNKILEINGGGGDLKENLVNFYLNDAVHQILPLTDKDNPVLERIIQDENSRNLFLTNAQKTLVLLDHDHALSKTYLSTVVDPKILNYLYPGIENSFKFQISEQPSTNNVFELNLNSFFSETEDILKLAQDAPLNILQNYIQNKAVNFLGKVVSNNPLFKKISIEAATKFSKLFPGRLSFGGNFIKYTPTSLTFFTSRGIPAFALTESGFSALTKVNTFVTPVSNWGIRGLVGFSRATFTTAKGLSGEIIGVQLGKATLTLTKTVGKEGVKWAINLLSKAATKGLTTAASTAISGAGGAAAGAAAGSAVAPVIGTAIGFVVGFIVDKILGRAIRWLKENKEVALVLLSVPLLLTNAPAVLAFSPALLGMLAILGRRGFKRKGLFRSVLNGLLSLFAGYVKIILIMVLTLLVLTGFIFYVINSGAYIVPPRVSTTIPGGGPEPGGIVVPCDPVKAGADITNSLAQKIRNGIVRLLPITNGARQDNVCIVPTMIILHSSGGYDNDQGNDSTYSTLISRDLACQLTTDTNDTYLMQAFYEKQVEMAWCAGYWNTYGISIEISGECMGVSCSKTASACEPKDDLLFRDPPPHPCPPESELAFDAVCKVMQQYKIPWTQVYTHAQVPFSGKGDVHGKEWVNNYFIPKLKNECLIN